MGEYIPFSWAKSLAAQYGVTGSFAPGKGPLIMTHNNLYISPSICYEETFPTIMRKARRQGANIFVNITDDYWFPNSSLGKQHFEHARIRAIENGIPLIRSCNFGVSGVIDSLGKAIAVKKGTEIFQVLCTNYSSFTIPTLYTLWGDQPILILSFFLALFCFYPRKKQ